MNKTFKIINKNTKSVIQRGFKTEESARERIPFWMTDLGPAYRGSKIAFELEVVPDEAPRIENRTTKIAHKGLF